MLNSLFKTLFLLGNHTYVYEPMSQNHYLIIQKWHIVEESYHHGKMVISFFDKKSIFIENMNEQKFLMCYIEDAKIAYTHIESFIADYAHLLNNVNNISTGKCDVIKKRRKSNALYHCVKKPRNM